MKQILYWQELEDQGILSIATALGGAVLLEICISNKQKPLA
jgi:hypothetical protein